MRHLVVNQMLGSTPDAEAFLTRRRAEQSKVLANLKTKLPQLSFSEVPLFDTEVVGYYGLRVLGTTAFKDDAMDDGRYARRTSVSYTHAVAADPFCASNMCADAEPQA